MSGCNRPWLRTLGLTLLALLAVATLLNGLLHAWLAPGGDMFLRLNEYGYFRNGVFPHPQLALRKGLEITTVSVYPPYAMPMLAPFFLPGGAMQGRLVIQALSLLSLGLIGWVGQRLLRGAGAAAGVLGALAGAAISGNSNALAHGQFSLVCMGLITTQWLLLARQRRIPAGLCWALAMIKPQIALPFALPFLRKRWLRGLVVGVSLLVALSAVAFWHTGVTPLDYLQLWTRPPVDGFHPRRQSVGSGGSSGQLRPQRRREPAACGRAHGSRGGPVVVVPPPPVRLPAADRRGMRRCQRRGLLSLQLRQHPVVSCPADDTAACDHAPGHAVAIAGRGHGHVAVDPATDH